MIAGQKALPKFALLLLMSGLCLLGSILTSYFGSVSSLCMGAETDYRLPYLCATLILTIWFVTVTFQDFKKSTLIIPIIFSVVLLSIFSAGKLGLLKVPPAFVVRASFFTFFGLAFFNICFFIVRITTAWANISFTNSLWVQYLVIALIIYGAKIGSSTGIYFFLKTPDPGLGELLALSATQLSALKAIALIIGFVYSLGVAIGGWYKNRRRNVPWNYPDLVRDWALAVGSWGGTSFYNLDLSNVNFRNAKLANTDLRARKLYRTCFQGVTGLERARVDSRYLDLENPKVQKLLTRSSSEKRDFSQINLRGAYLQNADMRYLNLTDTDLTGADLQGADLRDSIMVGTKVIGVDFTRADLTGACIQDWSVNTQTDFTEVQCDYVYRRLDENGERCDRFPTNRNFEPREFESLYQEVENVVELIFKEGDNWQAALFSLKKLQIEDEELGLQLKGIEKRGDRWVVKVTYNQNSSKQEVERVLDATVEDMKHQLAAKERQINRLLGIMEDQAEALNRLSRQPFGNSFVITGSTITNLVGSGQIDYDEASNKIRSVVANGSDPAQVTTSVQNLLEQFQEQGVATNSAHQAELIQQLILAEAQKNPDFQQSFVQQGQQIADALPEGPIATAIKKAIAQLS